VRIYHLSDSDWTPEPDYNTIAKRFFPWDGMEAEDWGGAWVQVLPGETSTPHHHEENEVFFIVRGTGLLQHGDEQHRLAFGSSMYMTPGVEHCVTNDGQEPLVFLSIWWDKPVRLAAPSGS
jgi:mannose-6-phosphate isomerase-like protein (cupin superfamily)